jgi:hypothetical protein
MAGKIDGSDIFLHCASWENGGPCGESAFGVIACQMRPDEWSAGQPGWTRLALGEEEVPLLLFRLSGTVLDELDALVDVAFEALDGGFNQLLLVVVGIAEGVGGLFGTRWLGDG